MDRIDVGNRIREERQKRGWTQEELAHKVGYKSRASINKLELERDMPIRRVKPIADAFGMTVNELMGWNIRSDKADLIIDKVRSMDDSQLTLLASFINYMKKKE